MALSRNQKIPPSASTADVPFRIFMYAIYLVRQPLFVPVLSRYDQLLSQPPAGAPGFPGSVELVSSVGGVVVAVSPPSRSLMPFRISEMTFDPPTSSADCGAGVGVV